MMEANQALIFASTVLPIITLFIFTYGIILRFLKWFMIWKVSPITGGVIYYRGSRLKGVFNSFILDHLPSYSLAARKDMAFYTIGVGMHLSFLALLLTRVHESSLLGFLRQAIPIPEAPPVYFSKPASHVLSVIFIVCLTLMIARRVYQYVSGKHLKAISGIGDFIAAPLLWIIGVTGFITATMLSQIPYDLGLYVVTSHLVAVQVFLMYTPFSKFFHGITSIIVMALSGLKKAALGEV